MSIERLEEIELEYSTLTVSSERNGIEYTEVDVNDLVFLIQNSFKQAKRVEELEQQNERYREALTFYAEESNYDYDVKVDSIGYIGDQSDMKFYRLDSAILNDRGEKARQALEDEE